MTVALVGPTSYIAEHLISALEEGNKQYSLISLRKKGEADYGLSKRVVFRDELRTDKVRDMAIRSAVLCASMNAKESEEDPERASYVNTKQVLDVVDALAGVGTKRFMYLSTIKVYGEDLEGRITETTRAIPTTIYGKTHYDTEVALRQLASKKGIEVLVLRLSNVFGAPVVNKDSAWSLAANCFARQMASKGSIEVRSPEVTRNILPMEDLISFILKWLERSIETSTVEMLNMGSKTTLSMKSLAELVKGCYLGQLGEDYIHSLASSEKDVFQYSTELSLSIMGGIEAGGNNSVILEMRRLCDASKTLFG